MHSLIVEVCNSSVNRITPKMWMNFREISRKSRSPGKKHGFDFLWLRWIWIRIRVNDFFSFLIV